MSNWYVITGSPSSGKTTTLDILKQKGFTVYYEWARIYIDEQIKKGRTLSDIRKDEIAFQKKILELKINFEKKLQSENDIFLERGIPDSIAYLELCGAKKDLQLINTAKKCKYKKVFLMNLVEYEVDYARTETKEEAVFLETLLKRSYKDLGFLVIEVPFMSVDKRIDFILDKIK